MKKQRGFLTLCLMLTFFLGNVTGQIQESYKQFPTLPDRPFVPPAAGQLKAWQEFQSSHPDWQVRWDKETGAPASLLGKPMDVARGTPEAIARQFLLMNRDIFRMKTELADLTVSKISPMRRATHVVFTQSYAGIPVEGGVYAVHMTKENKVYLANGDYFDNVQVATTEPATALENAINTAKEDLGADLELRGIPSGELVILPYGANFLLSWKVAVPADEPFGEWIYFISASDGSILTGYNSADFVSATGSVYDHHPDAGSVVYRTLTNLVSPGYYLNGNYVRAYNDDTSEAYETDLTYYYSPSNTHFDEVMVYYHANRFQDIYLDDL
ncbi:MAG: hypothetical protein J3T61_06675, partial [Candidatus Brocadiales bacterium]|nr:hypothetical protein [Candidatus Bathyanammoxibius sp.]